MPNRMPPARGYDLTDYQLSRANLYNPLRDFLKHYAKRDRVSKFWDFDSFSDTADFTLAQTQTSTNFTVVDGLGGVVSGTTASVTTASISMIGKTRWNGNNNCMFEARFKVDTVASTFIIEAGLVNAAPATGASVVADIDTPSFFTTATNVAMFGIWNNQTHTSIAFASVGSFTSQTVASTLITAASATFTTPVADTYITARILLLSTVTGRSKMYGWVNGILRASHVGLLTGAEMGAVNGQSAIYPWFYLQTVAAAVKVPTLDYLWMSQDRAALSGQLE